MTGDVRQMVLPFVEEKHKEKNPGKNPKKKVAFLTADQKAALNKIEESKSGVVVGIDEVGLGSWAGPASVGVVVLPKGWDHQEVVDSKRISHKKRMHVWQNIILPNAILFGVVSAPPEDIDKEGIEPVRERLTEAAALFARVRYPRALVVQDGALPVEVDGEVYRVAWLPKADVLVPAVSAASILAKVSRDLFMQQMDEVYPGYDFKGNKGYRSERHVEGLRKLGPCPIHRYSFKPIQAYKQAAVSW